jgi:exodeoxyribonuclease-3
MRLISWNVNSLRARFDHIERVMEEQAPDVLCLQETKIEDRLFPRDWFEERGYGHLCFHGQKSYHGVAIAARIPLLNEHRVDWCAKGDARHVQAVLAGGVELHNFYVPAGGDEPDPAVNDKFAHKLAFLDEMATWSKAMDSTTPAILVGDLNVAPLQSDVWSHKALLKTISHTPIEVEKLSAIQADGEWVDVMRQVVPAPERLYSWWSYRARDWRAADRGRRLDHVWVTPPLKDKVAAMRVLEDVRGWTKPSDHAPVLVDFNFED